MSPVLPLLLAAAAAVLPTGSVAAQRSIDQEAASRASREGQILPLHVIRGRIQVRGADFIGADFDAGSATYRLKFMREGQVLWVDVDARTGRPVGRSR